MGTCGNIGTFLFVHSLISRIYTVSNVNIDIPMIKQEILWQQIIRNYRKNVQSFLLIKIKIYLSKHVTFFSEVENLRDFRKTYFFSILNIFKT